jgi:hypothetical protein
MKRAPSYKNTPSSMNPAALDVWKWVVKHFADDIYESKSMRDQWRKAKSHFERVCTARKISPYVPAETGQTLRLVALASRLERLARSL